MSTNKTKRFNYPKEMAGISRTKLYKLWRTILERCYLPTAKQYKYYGAKNLDICSMWKNNYLKFKTDMELRGYVPGANIIRIDKNVGYYPENIRVLPPSDKGLALKKTCGQGGLSFNQLLAKAHRNNIPLSKDGLKKRLVHMTPDEAVKMPYMKHYNKRKPKA